MLGKGVGIGTGCKFSYGLTIGAGSKLGINVFGGYHIVIGEQVCIENGVNLPNNAEIRDFAKVVSANKGKNYSIINEKEGFKFVLQKGKCVAVKR